MSSLSDFLGNEAVVKTIKQVLILPIKSPQSFAGKHEPWMSTLLFGPAGVGKRFLVESCGEEIGKSNFYKMNCTELLKLDSKKVAEKISETFAKAKQTGPSVVFIDDLESLDVKETETAKVIKLRVVEQMKNLKSDKLVLVASTNTPWTLDAAITKTLDYFLYVPLPETADRKQMFKSFVAQSTNSLTDQDFITLAEKTEGFSAGDINAIIKSLIAKGTSPIAMNDMLNSIAASQPTMKPENLAQFIKFFMRYG